MAAAPLAMLPPLVESRATTSPLVASLLRLAMPLTIIAAVIVAGLGYRRCTASTTRAVGTHYESRALALAIDFPH